MDRHYGGKRDRPDGRDEIKEYPLHQVPSTDQHPSVDLRKYIDHIYDQGQLDSCTANVLCAAYGLELKRNSLGSKTMYHYFDASRLFLYYNSRMYDQTTDDNVGVSIRDIFKAMKTYGVCLEALWPYDEQEFAKKPSTASYQDGLGNTITKYTRLTQDIDQFRACLKAGYPFAVGFEVYSSFRDLDTKPDGVMPLPPPDMIRVEMPYLHAVLAVGYDDMTQCITILNSWGKKFGDRGYFYMPYSYITDPKRAFDFWKIEDICERGVPQNL